VGYWGAIPENSCGHITAAADGDDQGGAEVIEDLFGRDLAQFVYLRNQSV